MNSGDGYLGMYNETELNVDNLNLNNLTASNGTITTLSSTTGTITTLNTTTANVTSLIGDVWQGTSGTSSMRIGSSSDTSGVIYVYKTMAVLGDVTNTINSHI